MTEPTQANPRVGVECELSGVADPVPADIQELAAMLDALGRNEAMTVSDRTLTDIAAQAAAATTDAISVRLDALARDDASGWNAASAASTANAALGAGVLRLVPGTREDRAFTSGSRWSMFARLAAAVAIFGGLAMLLVRNTSTQPTESGNMADSGMITAGFEPDVFAEELLDVWDSFDDALCDSCPEDIAETAGSASTLERSVEDALTDWSEALLFSTGGSSL